MIIEEIKNKIFAPIVLIVRILNNGVYLRLYSKPFYKKKSVLTDLKILANAIFHIIAPVFEVSFIRNAFDKLS